MEKRFYLSGMLAGIISGVIIGVLFKIIEWTTGVNVYTLLLNIDFIPILGHISFSEGIEFLFHLIVSVILTCILYVIVERYGRAFLTLTGVSVIVGIFIYPITSFSTRTPDLFSGIAFVWWIVGHFVYGLTLYLFYRIFQR